MTDGYRGRANKALGQLRKIGAKPEEIAPMLAEGRRQRASWNWTEIALANHWPTLKASLKARPAAAPAATASGDDEVIARCEHGVAMEELASCEPCSEAKARAIAKARDALRTASRGIALERQAS